MTERRSFEQRVLALCVAPKGVAIYADEAWMVRIEDESGGEFIEIRDGTDQKLRINPEEWPALRAAVDRLVGECRDA